MTEAEHSFYTMIMSDVANARLYERGRDFYSASHHARVAMATFRGYIDLAERRVIEVSDSGLNKLQTLADEAFQINKRVWKHVKIPLTNPRTR